MSVEAYQAGERAYYDRADLRDNPYDYGENPTQHTRWLEGWYAAEMDHEYEDAEIIEGESPLGSGSVVPDRILEP